MHITISHGNGGQEMAHLIDSVFIKHFQNEYNQAMEDAATLPMPHGTGLAFTTDSFVVEPLFFNGGDIGHLAVCGTVNDLLTTGAKPLYLTASFIIEEGASFDTLDRIAQSMARTARKAGVVIVTGDTKVIAGKGGVYINTAGIGAIEHTPVTTREIAAGDGIIVTGTLGDHHACIVSARMGIENNIPSDAAPLVDVIAALKQEDIPLHGMRDITRGGLATVANELARTSCLHVQLEQDSLPITPQVQGLCGILGLDPLYMGNEGNMLLVVPQQSVGKALAALHKCPQGKNASLIGAFTEGSGVSLSTPLGGSRIIAPLTGEGLPRIC